MVLIFTDLKKAQIYKMPYRDSPHQEIEIVTKLDYQHLFRAFGLDERTHARRETNENFLFKIEDKKYIYVGDIVYRFETIDDIDEYFSETGLNDKKYHFGLSNKNVYFMLDQKYITTDEFENSEMLNEYDYLYKKNEELRGDDDDDGVVEYGNDFLNCEINDSKQI